MIRLPKIIFSNALLLVLSVVVASCVEEVNPKGLVNTGRKVVINSLISPQDSIISVEVSLSRPVLGITNFGADFITDAEVNISDGTSSHVIPFDDATVKYNLETDIFPIQAGKQYFLEVKTGGNTYKASCQVPETPATDIRTTISEIRDGFRLRVFWKDQEGEENYYRVSGAYKDDVDRDRNFYLGLDFAEEGFKKDDGRDGEVISADTDISLNYFINGQKVLIDSLEIQLLTTDKNYYEYQKVLVDIDQNENPFAEPVRLISNIEGEDALGIFAAYQSEIKKMKVE